MKAAFRQDQILGVDESGININGENYWVHVAGTDNLTHLAFHYKYGTNTILEIGIINEFTGALFKDGFSSYQKLQTISA